MQSQYRPPDFNAAELRDAPDARFEPAPADGVLPEHFFSTTNLPTYVRVNGEWRLPRAPRMDSAIVLGDDGSLRVVEGRYLKRGERVAVGYAEDGSEGIYVDTEGLEPAGEGADESDFQFMRSEVSREKPVDYATMAKLLRAERDRGGHIVWVLGPAVLHARGRDVISWFIQKGYVNAMLGGNAVGVHDIEQALMGTTLGMDRTGRPMPGGHAFHMRAINQISAAGSIRAAVDQGLLTEGIMYNCVKHGVPFVLAGSIRDDGPLPDTIRDVVRAQELMRVHAQKATMAIMVATALHSIGFGNMLPAYVTEPDGSIRPLTTIAVDSSEFVVSKLKDRGTHQAFGVITNAQDFLHVLRHFVEQLGQGAAEAPATEASVAKEAEVAARKTPDAAKHVLRGGAR
jgi:lysine-ketoglutarate reductase/saccharopine dehydrogenase-like protein (TIGR00300 family)